MNFVAIPTAVFTDPAFVAMTHTDRDFLIHLYFKYSDCASFVLEEGYINEEWRGTMKDMCAFVRRLVESGLLKQIGSVEVERSSPKPRIFTFKYSSTEFYER